MNMAPLDWAILFAVWIVLIIGVVIAKRYMRSVADFLAAGRTGGRYLVSLSQGMAALGAITIIGMLEMNYVAGFSLTWWGLTTSLVILLITVSGWVIYRFRETRCLTLAEFFERRYSPRFRVFAGLVAYLAGIVNFGIFPAVGARFFIHFTGLPQSVTVAGIAVDVFPLTMFVLLATSLYFVFSGGQIAVLITNFLQGVFVNLVFLWMMLYLLTHIGWERISPALATAPENASLTNPFETSHVEDFNFGYFLIGVVGLIYNAMAWQGTQAYNASAKSAHEAKMGGVLSNWRNVPQNLFLVLIPILAYVVLHDADFGVASAWVEGELATVETEAVQNQLRVPLVLTQLLPVGLMGAFAAVMLAAFISTHQSYLHSWGSIFVQDVLMPFRKTPYAPQEHLRVLRRSITGVALFVFVFSLIFRQSQYIFMFFAITGAIFVGGAGAVIIGGLYWKRGTTGAAWAAMLTGSAISVGGIVVHQLVDDFPINGQVFWGIAMAASSLIYVVVSLLSRRTPFDLDRLLHRDSAAEGTTGVGRPSARGLRLLGMGREFTRGDRFIYFATYAWTFSWLVVFAVGTVINLGRDVPDASWNAFWRVYVWIHMTVSAVVLVWFTIGGMRDLRAMLRDLDAMERDTTDDGMIRP